MKTPEQIAERLIEGFESRDEYTVNDTADRVVIPYAFLKEMVAEGVRESRDQIRKILVMPSRYSDADKLALIREEI